MPIESSVTKPSDLNVLYPENGDLKAVGPQHFRNLKTALKYLNTTPGTSELGHISDVTGAVATTVQEKLRGWAELEADFGAAGDGTTDDTAAIQLAANSGKRVRLRHGSTYKVTSTITCTTDGFGLVGDGSQTFYMPSANWTNTAISNVPPNGSTTVCLFRITNYPTLTLMNNILLKDFKIQSQVSDGRYLVAIWAAYINNFKIEGVEAYGFPASRVFQFDTLLKDSHCIDCYVHDCTTNVTSYASNPMIHCLTLDSSRVNSTPSDGFKIINFKVVDCVFGATAITAYGEQSDGINLNGAGDDADATTSRNHLIINPYIKNTGDCIDMFCQGAVIIGGQLIDGYNDGIKVTTGARRNKIIGTHILRPGLFGISFESAQLPGYTQDVEDNDVIGVTVENVNPNNVWSATNSFAFGTRYNGTPTFFPHRNRVIGCRVVGPNTYMRNAVRVECGDGNEFDVRGENNAVSDFTFVHPSLATNTVIGTGKKTHIRAYVNGNETITGLATETVVFDTEQWDTNGEFNTTTFTYTANAHRLIRVKSQVRLASAGAAVYRLYIQKTGVNVAETEFEVDVGGDLVMDIDDVLQVVPGDTVKILFLNGDADRVMTGDARFSYLLIDEL